MVQADGFQFAFLQPPSPAGEELGGDVTVNERLEDHQVLHLRETIDDRLHGWQSIMAGPQRALSCCGFLLTQPGVRNLTPDHDGEQGDEVNQEHAAPHPVPFF